MVISQQAIDYLLKPSEGYRTHAYKDAGGRYTIGWGHAIDVQPNGVVSVDGANQLLADDLEVVYSTIYRYIGSEMSQCQFDAVCDFVFNLGEGNFKKSTLCSLLQNGDYTPAANEFPKWTKVHGVDLPGLVTRRQKEKDWFLGKLPNGLYTTDLTPWSIT